MDQIANHAENPQEAELFMMEQFAAQYSFGVPLSQALIASGYGTRSLAKGFELLQLPFVQSCIDRNRDWIKERLVDNVNTLLSQLDSDRTFAYTMENASAAVSATMAKAKLLGLLDPDKSKNVPTRITIEWDGADVQDVKDIVL